MNIKKRIKEVVLTNTIQRTSFVLPAQTYAYTGKVRDVYILRDHYMVMITTDRISAFDYVLPRPIPHKGQVLNLIADYMLDNTLDIIPNWKLQTPDPNVMIGIKCDAYPVEMVVRGYLVGHAWREYKAGRKKICGVQLPDGLKENDKLPTPILTPTTKEEEGHDADISREQILAKKLIPKNEYEQLEKYALALYQRGCELAEKQGLILMDSKYEFGKEGDFIMLIDEVHTPDSSRYIYADGYEQRQKKGEKQTQLSKEFVREWLMANGFQGLEGQIVPAMPDTFVDTVSEKYIHLYETLTGKKFERVADETILDRVKDSIYAAIKTLK
jgi:phosphoribosylaminoimidazole-succinocarboxamide synthase